MISSRDAIEKIYTLYTRHTHPRVTYPELVTCLGPLVDELGGNVASL